MKKALSVLLLLSLVLCLAACGGKSSNVSIETLEQGVLKDVDSEASFTKTETSDGFSFSAEGTYHTSPFRYVISGTADKKEHVTSFTLTIEQLKVDYTKNQSLEQWSKDINDVYNVPVNKLMGDFFLGHAATAIIALSEFESDSSYTKDDAFRLVFDLLKTPQTIKGWNYSFQFDESAKTGTFTAQFTG